MKRIEARRSLFYDSRGAMMVVGTFMAVFLVGVLYHLIGVVGSVGYHERLQDGADAAAYTAATTFARASNLISIVNLGMFVMYTVLTALTWAEGFTSSCASVYPSCGPPYARITAALSSSGPRIETALRQATRTGEALRDTAPALAEERALALVDEAYSPPARRVIVIAPPMPLETASWRPLCAWSRTYAWPLADAISAGQITIGPQPYGVSRGITDGCRSDLGVGPQLFSPLNETGLEPYQVRVILAGDERVELIDQGVRVPRRVHENTPLEDDERPLARFAVAQAEYYSHWRRVNRLRADTRWLMPEQNAFFMHFRARWRRVRVPMDAEATDPNDRGLSEWMSREVAPRCGSACVGMERAMSLHNGGMLH